MANEQPTGQAIKIVNLRFGETVTFDDDTSPIVADAGDILLILPHSNGTKSTILLDPDQALKFADAMLNAAGRGQDMLRAHQKELGNDRP